MQCTSTPHLVPEGGLDLGVDPGPGPALVPSLIGLALAALCLSSCGGSGGSAAAPVPGPPLAPSFLSRFAPVHSIKILLLNLDYPADGQPPFAAQEVQAVADGMRDIVARESYGQASASIDTLDVLMPEPMAGYAGNDYAAKIRRDALRAAGFALIPAGYDRLLFLGPKTWTLKHLGLWAGHGIYVSTPDPVLCIHELGHSYDRDHANAFDPAAASPNQGSVEYGDEADYMGLGLVEPSIRAGKGFHARTRLQLGWLQSPQVVAADAPGGASGSTTVYTIGALEQGAGVVALVLRSADPTQSYWLQYRGTYPTLLQGPVLGLAPEQSNGDTKLLDPTPGTRASSWQQAFLAQNVPFTAPEGFTVETLAVSPGALATVRISFPAGYTPTSDRLPQLGVELPDPSIDVFSGVQPIQATAYDPDSPGLQGGVPPYDWAGIQEIQFAVSPNDLEDPGPPLVKWSVFGPAEVFQLDTTAIPDAGYLLYVTAIPVAGLGAPSRIRLSFVVINS